MRARRTNSQLAASRAVLPARHGAVVVALDAPFARRGDSPARFNQG